jgi:hypothetical protein
MRNPARLVVLGASLLLVSSQAAAVSVSEVTWQDRTVFKVETKTGTYYWESAPNRSGFMSFVDKDGWDWIQSGYGPKPIRYRGFPNSIDRWGHPSEDNGTAYNKIVGPARGDHVIVESEKVGSIKARLHFFDSHLAIEVLSVKDAPYALLYEGTPGGDYNAKHFVLPDGSAHEPKPWCGVLDWPADGPGEWFYLVGKNSKVRLWFAHTPAEDTKSECFSGFDSKPAMDVFSFGRTCENEKWTPFLKGTDHKVMAGFVGDESMGHEQIRAMVQAIMKNPFQPWRPGRRAGAKAAPTGGRKRP